MADPARLYDEDFLAWTRHQADALRAAALPGSNQVLDWGNLAEDIESFGKSQRNALASHIANIIEHLVKLEHSPARDPRPGWRRTIRRGRAAVERLIEESPSLEREVDAVIAAETRRAVGLAVDDLLERGELDNALQAQLRRVEYNRERVCCAPLPESRSGS